MSSEIGDGKSEIGGKRLGVLLVLSGPAGSGKSTILKSAVALFWPMYAPISETKMTNGIR